MSNGSSRTFDPQLDLLLERVIDVPPEKVWAAWTTPALLMPWFCPKPWTVSACEIDLRPGGRFFTMLRSPEGQEMPNDGCILEVVPGKRLVFTDALTAGYRPAVKPFMTASITIEPSGAGTRYIAYLKHADAETRDKHETMGFSTGWGMALDQLVAMIKAG
ncbi:MAG: activator of ATPase [Phycisphaerales bacterium]|nr:activator of ATPase [Phycisphaerales bacterium]